MEISLEEEISKMPDMRIDYLADREKAEEFFEQRIVGQLLNCREDIRKVVVNCLGILSASSSFIDELFFIDIFSANYRHGNSILVLTNLSDELYFNICLAVEGKKNLIEKAKKRGRYFLTRDMAKVRISDEISDDTDYQVGSPYLLCEHQGKIEVMGFNDGEKQKILLERIVQKGERITAGQLSEEEEHRSRTTANNRLDRLYKKRLVFRRRLEGSAPEKYEYFFD